MDSSRHFHNRNHVLLHKMTTIPFLGTMNIPIAFVIQISIISTTERWRSGYNRLDGLAELKSRFCNSKSSGSSPAIHSSDRNYLGGGGGSQYMCPFFPVVSCRLNPFLSFARDGYLLVVLDSIHVHTVPRHMTR